MVQGFVKLVSGDEKELSRLGDKAPKGKRPQKGNFGELAGGECNLDLEAWLKAEQRIPNGATA